MTDNSGDTTKKSMLNKQLGDYKLVETLAVGGMSQVYVGEDVKLGRKAAIKVLTQELLEKDANLTERFQREARAVAALEHDNIITIYQYGEQDGIYFLAMRLVTGHDLADELNRLQRQGKLMKPGRMLDLLAQVAAALDHAHTAGIIHRDIKPSNILIDKNDKAILTDFGLVLRQQVDQTMGTAFGTPRYISPEQALASENAVPQSDVYSLAVIVYEIITGQMIYKADTAMGFALSHISEPPPPPRSINSDIPRSVEREVLKALDKRPEKRHQTAAEFVEALKDAYRNTMNRKVALPPAEDLNQSATPVFGAAPDMQKMLKEKQQKDAEKSQKEAAADPATLVISEENTLSPETVVKPDKKRSLLPILIGGMFIAIVAIAGLVLSGNLDESTTDSAQESAQTTSGVDTDDANTTTTDDDPEPTAAVISTNFDGDSPVIATYNFDVLALRNESSEIVDLSSLVMIRPDNTDRFEGDIIPGGELEPGACMIILLQVRRIEIPDEWDCSDDSSETTLNSDNIFWRNDETDSFEIRFDDEIIAQCDAIARGSDGECSFDWIAAD